MGGVLASMYVGAWKWKEQLWLSPHWRRTSKLTHTIHICTYTFTYTFFSNRAAVTITWQIYEGTNREVRSYVWWFWQGSRPALCTGWTWLRQHATTQSTAPHPWTRCQRAGGTVFQGEFVFYKTRKETVHPKFPQRVWSAAPVWYGI